MGFQYSWIDEVDLGEFVVGVDGEGEGEERI